MAALKQVIEFYTRAGCRLCDQALPLVEREARRLGFTVRVRDVDADPDLAREYGLAVPVVVLHDRRLLAGRIAEAEVVAALRAAARSVESAG
ncbi:MAG: glutaredoxin family protein [Planctomycetes bacterium]|nr:glutaredoxin family protein [Planctomycetota bacterium]